MTRCLYQGEKGAYSYVGGGKWNPRATLIGKRSFKEVFVALEAGEAEYAIVPVENSSIGTIPETQNLISQYDSLIVAKIELPIEHCLLSPSRDLASVRRVYSHPKALEQCGQFFKECPALSPESDYDTAGAAKEVARRARHDEAAIASIETAGLYGLHVLRETIQDQKDNTTYFAVIKISSKHCRGNI